MKSKIDKLLFCVISPVNLAVFRIAFGFFSFLEIIYFYKTYLIEDYILQPKVLFNYSFLPVLPLPETALDIILGITLISTVFIIIGKFYRVAIITFFIGFTYFFLLDKAYYNNHMYLFSLLAFLLIFIPADGALAFRGKKKSKPVYGWHLRILQFQFIVVYFFGGVAKINGDWLMFYEPMRTILEYKDIYSEELSMFLAYSGLLFDLFIGFFLLNKRTRIPAAIFVLVFNITNHLIFDDINIFPFFMMGSLVLFFELDKMSFFSRFNKPVDTKQTENSNKLVLIGVGIYVLIQITMPIRHYFIPGNVDWTGEGQRFAWRMKIQTREIRECKFAIFDLNKKTIYPVEINAHINAIQLQQMTHSPKMILDFAHYLKEYARKEGLNNVMIKARITVKYNQREAVEILSPDIDLSKEKWSSFSHNKWINPLQN